MNPTAAKAFFFLLILASACSETHHMREDRPVGERKDNHMAGRMAGHLAREKARLADHYSGHHKLEAEELRNLQRRIEMHARKGNHIAEHLKREKAKLDDHYNGKHEMEAEELQNLQRKIERLEMHMQRDSGIDPSHRERGRRMDSERRMEMERRAMNERRKRDSGDL